MNNNVRCRYEEFLKLYPDLYNIVSKNLIAAYLGVRGKRSAGYTRCEM